MRCRRGSGAVGRIKERERGGGGSRDESHTTETTEFTSRDHWVHGETHHGVYGEVPPREEEMRTAGGRSKHYEALFESALIRSLILSVAEGPSPQPTPVNLAICVAHPRICPLFFHRTRQQVRLNGHLSSQYAQRRWVPRMAISLVGARIALVPPGKDVGGSSSTKPAVDHQPVLEIPFSCSQIH